MEQVLDALERQVACYERLAKLAAQQREHVQSGQTEALLNVLALRQEVLGEVSALERTIAPARRQWALFLEQLPPARHEVASDLLQKTRMLLERITTADREDALMLQQRKLNLGRQIGQARSARQVNRNYAASAYGQPAARVDVGG